MSVVRRIQIGENHKSATVLNRPTDDILTLSGLTPGDTFAGFVNYPTLTGELGVTSNLYPVGNVKRYGAVGDGVTDDTTAVQAAITAISAIGGGVAFAPRSLTSYAVNILTIPAGVTLQGAGMGATTFQKIGSESGTSIFFIRLLGDRAQLRDCTVKGLGSSGFFGFCVAVTNSASHCRVLNVEMRDYHIGFNVGGIQSDSSRRWDNCNYNLVQGCYVHDFDDACTAFYAPTAAYGNRMIGCTTKTSSGGSGNEMRNQRNGAYIGCHAEAIQYGFRFEESSADCVAIGCTTKGCLNTGFHALGSVSTTGSTGETRDCQFIGCTSDGDATGFQLANANRIGLTGCTATNATTFGFIVTGGAGPVSLSDDFVISGCLATGCGTDGFRVQPGFGARGRIQGTARSNTAAGCRIRLAAGTTGQSGLVDVTASGNATDIQMEEPTWEVRVPRNTVTLLNGGGANIQPNATTGDVQRVRVTNATAFTISIPTQPHAGGGITIEVENASGGAMGTITWGGNYKLAGTFTNPATGNIRAISFRYDAAGAVWREVSRSAADQAV